MIRFFTLLFMLLLCVPVSALAQYGDPRHDWWYFYRQPRNTGYYAPASGGYPTHYPTYYPTPSPTPTFTPTPTYTPTPYPTNYPPNRPIAEAHARATATAADGSTATAEAHAVASGGYGYEHGTPSSHPQNQHPIAFTLSGEPVFFVGANDAYYRFFPVNNANPADYCEPSWYWQMRWRTMQWRNPGAGAEDYPLCQLRYQDQDFFYSPLNQQALLDYDTPYNVDPVISRKFRVKEVVKTRNHKYVYKTVIKERPRFR